MSATFLQDACLLARRSIVARLDRARDLQPHFRLDLQPTPRLGHDSWDYCDITGRYLSALYLLRRIVGPGPDAEEAGLRRLLTRMRDPRDGLYYNQAGHGSLRLADMFCQSRVLLALCDWYADTGDPQVLADLRHLVRSVGAIAHRRSGIAWYPRNLYSDGEWRDGGLFYQPKDLLRVHPGYGGTQMEGIVRYALLAGDDQPLEFVRQYLRFFLEEARVVREDGTFVGHLHSQGIVPTMVGAAMLAAAESDHAMLDLSERFLRFILSQSSTFGWIPDGIGCPTCETCCIADVVHLAALLSRAGHGDFWYEMERIGRNQLPANQFVDPALLTAHECPAPVMEAILGSFASWAHPNELVGGPDIEACCTGGGVQAIHRLLSNTVEQSDDGTVSIHMLFSVNTPQVLLESDLPFLGRVEIHVRSARRLRIRIPENADDRSVAIRVNGVLITPVVSGRYLQIQSPLPSDRVEMTWPVQVTTVTEEVAGRPYRVTWTGSTVATVAPKGRAYPIYLGMGRFAGGLGSSAAAYPVLDTLRR